MRQTRRALCLAVAALLLVASGAAAASLQPIDLQVSNGAGWRPDNEFRLRWDRLPGEPPARATYFRLLDAAGNQVLGPVGILGDLKISGIHVPGPGSFTAEVWLEDHEHHFGSSAKTTLAFDDVRPRPVTLQAPTDWIAASKAAILAVEPTAPLPVSGVLGFAYSVDRGGGSSPCAGPDACLPSEVAVPGDARTLSPGTLPDGVNVVRVVAVSGSGLRSVEATSAIVRVDATAPEVSIEAAAGWRDRPQRVEVAARDLQAGMSAAGPTGPYTAVAVDGGTPRREPGATVSTLVSGEGVHEVAAYGRDAVGNSTEDSPQRVAVRIDETPPRLTFADAQDPADPERIEVEVSDPLSGVAAGQGSIGLRPAGSHQRFQPLPTDFSGGRLIARWDSDGFAPGAYEFRASAADVAGNLGSSERRAGGGRMVLGNPVKTPTQVLAGFGGRRLTWQRCRRRGGQRRCHREEIESYESRPATRAIPYGRRLPYSGRLSTATGAGLGGLPVAIVESFAAGSIPAQRTTVVQSAADGSFATRLGPGPSRRVEVVFAGNRTLTRSGGGVVGLHVQAGVRFHPSAGVARIGGAPVLFRGRVADPSAVPRGGVPVELQFRLPGREWSQFRTIQSDGRGRFLYAYTFSDDDSRGVRFQFRAFVPAAAGWPYEPAASRPVFVTGR